MRVLCSTLRELGSLDEASDATLEALIGASSVASLAAGQVIAVQGTPRPPVCFVLDGALRVYRTNLDGRQQTLERLGPGSACYIPSAFTRDGKAPSSAEAVCSAKILRVSQDEFRHLVARHPDLAHAALCLVSRRMCHLVGLVHDLGLLSVRARLARFLLEHFQGCGKAPARFTHEDIATSIGTVREVVSRTLRAFVREGLIRRERHRIIVVDPKGLEAETED